MSLDSFQRLIIEERDKFHSKVLKVGGKVTFRDVVESFYFDSERFGKDAIDYGEEITLSGVGEWYKINLGKDHLSLSYEGLEIKKFSGKRVKKLYDRFHKEICMSYEEILENLPF